MFIMRTCLSGLTILLMTYTTVYCQQALPDEGLKAMDEDRYRDAVTIFTTAIKHHPDDGYLFRLRGLSYYYLEELQAASWDFGQALLLDSSDSEAAYQLGFTYYRLGIYDSALFAFTYIITTNRDFSGMAEVYCNRGLAYYQTGSFDKAKVDFEKALVMKGEDALTLYHLGLSLLALYRYDEAVSYFDRAISADSDLYQALLKRGESYSALELYQQALGDFINVLRLSSNYYFRAAAYLGKAKVYWKLGFGNEAFTVLTEAIDEQPENKNLYLRRGVYHSDRDYYDSARADFLRAIEIDSLFAEAWYQMARMEMKSGNYKRAISAYDTALSISESPLYFSSRANAQYLAGEDSLALDDYNKALSLDKRYGYALLQKGLLELEMGDTVSGIANASEGLRLSPELYQTAEEKKRLESFLHVRDNYVPVDLRTFTDSLANLTLTSVAEQESRALLVLLGEMIERWAFFPDYYFFSAQLNENLLLYEEAAGFYEKYLRMVSGTAREEYVIERLHSIRSTGH